jgi:cytochrome c-type biogenesis protein CcmH
LEARAQGLAREIRCVVCENEPVALSSADIAVDMRAAIRQRVQAGDTDAQVRRYFAERYGEFVLLRPRVGLDTLALWGTPLLLLLLGGGGLLILARRPRASLEIVPETDDKAALDALAELEASQPK